MPSQKHAIRVYVSDEEHQAITAKAESAGLSCSCYAKRICLGFPISSKVDAGAVRELIRTRADLGRLGDSRKATHRQIQQFLGHMNLRTTETYLHELQVDHDILDAFGDGE